MLGLIESNGPTAEMEVGLESDCHENRPECQGLAIKRKALGKHFATERITANQRPNRSHTNHDSREGYTERVDTVVAAEISASRASLRSQYHVKNTGTEKSDTTSKIIPPTTGSTIGTISSDPRPVDHSTGMRESSAVMFVMIAGRRRRRPAMKTRRWTSSTVRGCVLNCS